MGALPPASHWLPQDDFLLKNAAEAGASLQSLAKGAVQFSRRFTVQELQDRWNSLLYDPVVSEQASAEMVQLECSLALSKLNRFDNDKDVKSVSGKRKTESVKSCYYSMRKRICNEAYPSMDMNFLTGFNNNSVPPLPDYVFEDSLADQFGDQPSGFDYIDNVFPDLDTAHANSIGGGLDGANSTYFASEHDDNLLNSIDVHENVSATGLEVQAFNSPVSDCGKSFHTFGHSPSSQMPEWAPIEGTSPILPNFQLPKEDPEMISDFPLPVDGDGNEINIPAFGIIQSEPNVEDQVVEISTPSTDDLLAHIDSILNSTSEDDMFPIDDIGIEIINESYLDTYGSLLLDSPNGEQMENDGLPLVSVPPDEHLNIAHLEESADKSQYHYGDRFVGSEVQMLSSALSVNPAYPELRNGVICCTLNTEDPDIPSNDDVFLPVRMPSTSLPSMKQWKYDSATFHPTSSSLRNASNSQTNKNGWSVLKKMEQSNLEQSHMPSSQKVELPQNSRMGLNRSASDCGVRYEVPNSDTGNVIRRNTSSNEVPKLVTSPRLPTICALPVPAKETITKNDHTKNLNCNRNQQSVANPNPPCLQKKTVTIKQELGSANTLPKNEPLRVETVSTKAAIPESSAEALLLEQEDLPADSDEDIPHFSDVEALILNMDLSPDDKDICFNKGVAKYQHPQTKRTFMRLEQAAEARTQRWIAAHGALAVLYSRHSNHFIKKPEVLLGRRTADMEVDIDLSRECCGNKVSRRQAIIKINADGVFVLQNLTKHLIHVNGKEIAENQSAHLTSSSLIEVRGLAFVFETNHRRVKQLADGMRRGTIVKENES